MQETQEMRVWSLGQEDPLKQETAIHFSILVWKIPWSEEPDGYSPWGPKESDKTEWLSMHVNQNYGEISPTPVRMVIIKSLQMMNAGEDVWRKGNPPTVLMGI